MPLYEYECSACGSLFEQRRAIGEEGPSCPSCSSEHVVRRISLFAAATSSGGFRGSAPAAGGGGCACGGSCMCGGH